MRKQKRLTDAYRFAGWTPSERVKGVFGDPKAIVIELKRRQKKQSVHSAVNRQRVFTIARYAVSGIFPVVTGACMWSWKFDASFAGGARK
jgi:hypothetical protein